jgi:hypothetical protein
MSQNCIRCKTRENYCKFWNFLNFGFKTRERNVLLVIGALSVHRAFNLCLSTDRSVAAAAKGRQYRRVLISLPLSQALKQMFIK